MVLALHRLHSLSLSPVLSFLFPLLLEGHAQLWSAVDENKEFRCFCM